ncbi:hypothetical protein L915_19182 [Phytophthora nicotianae]|uniref:Uncharacterized protein n=1 Tax=Phytophthora nicotianae TaxID=4792 RepID=W2FTG4_PHYNI|nr:hypothetical protein L915_19182 [Phytophthora nicotianae]
MASSNVDQALPNAFFAFFEWCQEQRWWDRLDEAARYLRNWVLIRRNDTSCTADAINRSLDVVQQARITEARLIGAPAQNDDTCEHEWVLPFGMNRRGLPTFQMRTILDDEWVDGRVVF